jgi:cytochrome c oxidase subunit 2
MRPPPGERVRFRRRTPADVRRGTGVALPAAVAALGMAVAGCLPAAATTEGRDVERLYGVFVAIAAVVAAVVLGLTAFAIVRYRARPGQPPLPPQVAGNIRLEAVWTGIPIVIILALLALTIAVLGTFDASARSSGGVDIRVTAFRWGWRFEYPEAGVRVEGDLEPGPEVEVPVGEPVHVTLTGNDVIHAFYVPQFLFKKDAVPGRLNTFAFTVDAPGRYGGQCAEFCGAFHSRMPFTIVAVTPDEFRAWLASRGVAGGSASP